VGRAGFDRDCVRHQSVAARRRFPGAAPNTHVLAPSRPAMPKKVIVVDDDVGVLPVITDMLEELGCDAEGFRSPTQAFVKVATDPGVEMLIADINMATNRLRSCRKVRQIRPDVEVLLLSGKSQGDTRYPVLRKPFMRADLAQVMELPGLSEEG
jgi:two-component system, cell cycle response regulator CpdR